MIIPLDGNGKGKKVVFDNTVAIVESTRPLALKKV